MASYDQLPGQLNLSIRGGDRLSAEIDFNPISLTGYTMAATVSSLVGGGTIASMTTSFVDASAGKVNVSLTGVQTSGLPKGTYRLDLTATDSGSVRRSYLTGFIEVTR